MADEVKTEKPANILIEYTGDHIRYIADKLFLNTGITEVPTSVWEKHRWMVADLIVPDASKLKDSERKEGRIVELFAKVEVAKENAKDEVGKKTTVSSAKALNDLEYSEAQRVISETCDVKTLKSWLKSASDSLRPEIHAQIEKIEKEGEAK